MLASPLPPPLSISLICPGQEQGISPAWLTRSRAGDRRKEAESPGLRGGRGVPAVGWPVWLQGRDVEGCYGSPWGWIPWQIPYPGLSHTLGTPAAPHFCSTHSVSCWVSAPCRARLTSRRLSALQGLNALWALLSGGTAVWGGSGSPGKLGHSSVRAGGEDGRRQGCFTQWEQGARASLAASELC